MSVQQLRNQLRQDLTKRAAEIKAQTFAPPAPAALPPAPKVPVATVPTPPTSKGKFLSGGFVDKTFDVLRTPEYALAGSLKYGGPAGGLKGIQNRSSFGNQPEDLNLAESFGVKNPKIQSGINFGASVLSPSIPVAKIAKIPGISHALKFGGKVLGKGADLLRKSEPMAKVIEKVVPYFRRPEVGKVMKDYSDNVVTRENDLYRKIEGLAKNLTKDEQIKVGQIIERKATGDPRLTAIAREMQALGESIGQEGVALNVLRKEAFEKYKNKYLPHIFEKYKDEARQFYKTRKGAEGYIEQFAPSSFYGLSAEVRAIEKAKLIQNLATQFGKKFGKKSSVPEGFVWARDYIEKASPAMKKALNRVALPKEVADYIVRDTTYTAPTGSDRMLNIWKELMTIWNPAYHSRNLMTNQILSGMQTGRSIPRTLMGTLRSAKQYLGRKSDKFADAAKEAGLIKRVSRQTGYDRLADVAGLSADKSVLTKIRSGLRGFQTGSEEISKLHVFQETISDLAKKMGVTIDEVLANKNFVKQAVEKAEEAIFSPYRISKQERQLASKVVPFFSFLRQSVPFIGKTLANNPNRVLKYEKIKEAIEGLSGDQKIPVSQRTEQYRSQAQLPGGKDGKKRFLDLSYILPWGSLDQSRGTLPFGLSFRPDIQAGIDVARNKDYFGNPVIPYPGENAGETLTGKYGRENVKGVAKYAYNVVEPTAIKGIKKIVSALKGEPDQYGRERTTTQAIMEAIFGLKSTLKGKPEMLDQLIEQAIYKKRKEKSYDKKIDLERLRSTSNK